MTHRVNDAVPSVAALLVLISVTTASHALAAPAQDELLTTEQLQQLAAEKKWTELLTGTSRALALRGEKAAGYDRVLLWSLKAEAQIQSSQFVPAAESFEKASQESTAKPDQVDWAYSMSMLMRKSDRRGYKPEVTRDNPAPPTFDILKEAERKGAIAALFEVQMSALEKRFNKVKTSLAVKPTLAVMKEAVELARLERAGLGVDERSRAVGKAVATAFNGQAEAWRDTSLKRIGDIRTTANELITEDAVYDAKGRLVKPATRRKRGLTGVDNKQLRDITDAAAGLAESCQQFERAIEEADRGPLEASKPTIQNVHDEAKRLIAEHTGRPAGSR